MCWNYIRKYRATILVIFILCYGGYEVLHRKALENRDIKRRLDKLKPTVPADLYDEIAALRWKLVQANFRGFLLHKKLLEIHKSLRQDEVNLLSPKYFLEIPAQNMIPRKVISKNTEKTATVAYGISINDAGMKQKLLATLLSLVQHATSDDLEDILFIVYVNIDEEEEVSILVSMLQKHFKDEIKNGMLDIIIPSTSYYPSYRGIEEQFGASKDIVIQNSKANLDMAYLMMYARTRAAFYVHLSTDLLAIPQYASKIMKFAIKKASSNEPWFELSFTTQKCAGKLYDTKDIDRLVVFLLMYHNIKPCEWIVISLVDTIYCNLEKSCYSGKEIKKHRIQYRPVLFKKQLKETRK